MVDTASAAMSIFSKAEQKIDVMIVNVHSSNMLSFHLLAQALDLDIVSLAVCDEHNEDIVKKALDEGAYVCLKKPFDREIVKYLWQFVLRKKIQKEKARERSSKNRDQMNVDDIGKNSIFGENEEQLREKKNVCNIEEQDNYINEVENNVLLNEKCKLSRKRGRKSMKEINERESQSSDIHKIVTQKNYIEWTDDLHAKFMEAVQQLGEGRCYPKEILEVMNVPGLTRLQIASHLQKWRHPSGKGSSSEFHVPKSSFTKFGTMPRLQKYVPNLQRNTDQTQRNPKFSFPTLNTNKNFVRGGSSIQQQFYRPQLPIQSHYLDICNPFNNPFLLAQNNVVGRIQQQYGPLFGMLNSQGLQGPITENTNYRSGLALNSGDNHTQSDYNSDLNVAQGAIYSGSEIMSGSDIGNATTSNYNLNVNLDNVATYSSSANMPDAYVGNVTINGFGAENSNFQQYIGEPNMFDPSTIVNHGNLSASLPNEQGNEFDQVYPDDQVAATSNVQFPEITDESSK
ncbi:putative two-component response regulator ARR21 [Solanum dulcamara]|uniref:putative two-component response regulator ARR21 n=1 Tax=Solanum dulcamara TaxID=45834 RepID=UPI002486CB5E|nr:putative two-component response regulator ARR21 [Solanum dulcamara]